MKVLCATGDMTRYVPAEHEHTTSEAIVDGVVASVAKLDQAIAQADLQGASRPELRQLLGLVSAVEEALDRLAAAVNATTAAS